jgi:hypothetical protein
LRVLGKCLAPNRGSIPRPATSRGLFHPTRLRDAAFFPLIVARQPTPTTSAPASLDHESRYGGTAGPPAHLTRYRAMQQPTPRDSNDWGAVHPTASLGGEGSKATAHPHIEHARAPGPLIHQCLSLFLSFQGRAAKPGPPPLDDASHWRGCFQPVVPVPPPLSPRLAIGWLGPNPSALRVAPSELVL